MPSLFRLTLVARRRGKPRPKASMFPDKYRRVPTLLKPQQGGQQYFSDFLMRQASIAAEQQVRRPLSLGVGAIPGAPLGSTMVSGDPHEGALPTTALSPRLPQLDLQNAMHQTTEEAVQEEMRLLKESDPFVESRGFNERAWYEEEKARLRTETSGPSAETTSPSTSVPERILGNDYFKERYGFSLLRREQAQQPPTRVVPPMYQGNPVAAQEGNPSLAADSRSMTAYSQLDLWAELPKYHTEMIFLYLISRRRNTYAVAYDYYGKRFLHPYTAGNRGLKGGDRGFRGDGSTDNGHQVTSAYLNDLIPKIREARAEAGLPVLKRGDKVDLVVRVMGFYNGRQGAVRAVQDRSAEFNVRYIEDITPFPLNGPKMPRGVFR